MISIIIPYFNKSNTIKKTLSSIDEALKNFKINDTKYEVIIVNDGSSIQETNKLHEYASIYQKLNIKIINKENGGVSSARNIGVYISNHPLLYFLDADDTISKNFFYYTDENVKKANHIFNLRINRKKIFHNLNSELIVDEDVFFDLLKKRCLHLSNFIFLKEKIPEFMEEIKVGEDILFIHQAILGNEIIAHNDFIGKYHYDGKFHSSEKNGLSFILGKTNKKKNIIFLEGIVNERNFLTNCFSNQKPKYNPSLISFKVKMIGSTRSPFLYSIIQKIRFFTS